MRLKDIIPSAKLKVWDLLGEDELKLYLIDDSTDIESLSPEVAASVMSNPLYWMFCWASGRVLAQQILMHPHWVKDKVVMDVGSGSGVVAIAAALMGAKQVIASDIDPISRQAIALNAELNGVEVNEYFSIIGDFNETNREVDLIVIADVLYDTDNIPLLEILLQRAPDILLADSRVKNFSYPGLEKIASFEGCTFPHLGGFDEFFEVNVFHSVKNKD